jgi:hypothetical protein
MIAQRLLRAVGEEIRVFRRFLREGRFGAGSIASRRSASCNVVVCSEVLEWQTECGRQNDRPKRSPVGGTRGLCAKAH